MLQISLRPATWASLFSLKNEDIHVLYTNLGCIRAKGKI